MKNLFSVLTGMLLLFAITSCLENKRAKNYNKDLTVDSSATAFIKKGLEAGLAEIKAAKVAQANSKNPRVINFAAMMIADHTKAADELEGIAIKARVSGGDSVSTVHQKMITDLSSKSGAAFDSAYMQMMLNDHADAIELFTDGSHNKNTDIKNFAQKVLPTLHMHLDSAKAVNASLTSK